MRRLAVALVVSALAVLAVPSSTSAIPPAPQPSCSPGPADCGEWHTSDVTVSWGGACPPATVSQDGAVGVSCTASDGSGSVTTTVIVRRDASPPEVRVSPERGPDHDGWYNRPLSVSFEGNDPTSGVASCSASGATYSGPDSGEAAVRATCTDNAGNTGRGSYDFRYDATPPAVEAKADRAPNARGWYNRELTVSFTGSDATSGLQACAPAVTYRGPDADKTAVTGTCVDKAANTSPPAAYELRYDTRPPVLARVRAEIRARGIVLKWKTSKDTFSVGVVRRPGLKGRGPSTIYAGRAALFTDRRLKKGVKYRYTVTAYDEAGNAAVKGLAVKAASTTRPTRVARPAPAGPSRPTAARPGLKSPAVDARLKAPPRLTWTPVRNATYYNVQLYIGGRKVLTAWPSGPSFQVPRSWRFQGRTHRLVPGRYRWYVWPGLGPRSASRYGKLVGTRTFVLVRG